MQSRGKTRTYYDILGVDRKCSKEELSKQWRKLVFETHPDVSNNSADDANSKAQGSGIHNEDRMKSEKFLEIQEAYKVLKDDESRRLYDLTLSAASPTSFYRYYEQSQAQKQNANGRYGMGQGMFYNIEEWERAHGLGKFQTVTHALSNKPPSKYFGGIHVDQLNSHQQYFYRKEMRKQSRRINVKKFSTLAFIINHIR